METYLRGPDSVVDRGLWALAGCCCCGWFLWGLASFIILGAVISTGPTWKHYKSLHYIHSITFICTYTKIDKPRVPNINVILFQTWMIYHCIRSDAFLRIVNYIFRYNVECFLLKLLPCIYIVHICNLEKSHFMYLQKMRLF